MVSKTEEPLVTKKSLAALLRSGNPRKTETIIGRAATLLYGSQTESEKNNSNSKVLNGVGFTSYDAILGSKTARMWMRCRRLTPNIIELWLKPNNKGFPRLCKYHKQLNIVAMKKQRKASKGCLKTNTSQTHTKPYNTQIPFEK